MTNIFAFTNHKGGVGKSTSATTLALGLVGVLRTLVLLSLMSICPGHMTGVMFITTAASYYSLK